ncbi:MAG: hypothetical protein JO265_16365, partial [Acidimicrobiia bacterium]|nr:hypothetical protein [Acidimicrobiia bacterium]
MRCGAGSPTRRRSEDRSEDGPGDDDELGDRRGYPEEAEALRQALDLVQGPPFAGVPERAYSWVFAEHLPSRMEAAIVGAAHRLAEVGLAHGAHDAAAWAAEKGLL